MSEKNVKKYENRIFAERLRTMMGKRNVGLAEIAEATNCAVSTASTWKRGRLPRRADTLEKIAVFLGVSPIWLSGEDVGSPVFSNESPAKRKSQKKTQMEFRRAKIIALVNSAMEFAENRGGGLRKFESHLLKFLKNYS